MGILGISCSPKMMLKSQSLLKAMFHFNEADLRDNQNGRMSDRQKMRLRCMQVLSPWHIGTVFLIGVQLCVLVAAIHFGITLYLGNDWFDFLRVLIAIIAITLTIIIGSLFLIRRLKKLGCDIQNGQVDVTMGTITFRRYGRKRLTFIYLIQIGDKEYRVMFWQMWAFRKHLQYSIYVAPQMQIVLSAEAHRIDK
jgi:hypothetical protein